ncbi:ATP-binding cassette domain-containing protein, partial [Pseudonocardia halophobica]|uniref:ATP-binding cassette domain-containing protein n=1 Tax=Pseudonocardia halophobica TaxID=29401 RepID=UPI0022F30040
MTTPIVDMRDIKKHFGHVIALNGVSFDVRAGECHCLLGDNGAGKSTLVKMISGINPPTSGEIYVNGKRTEIRNRSDSEAAGIETIYQDIALVDSMSITRNIFLGRELVNRWGFMDHRRMQEVAIQILGSAVQISGIDNPDKEVGFLSG